MRQRLLHVDVDTELDAGERRDGVRVVGRGDRDRVNLIPHLVKHLAEVAELARVRPAVERLRGAARIA